MAQRQYAVLAILEQSVLDAVVHIVLMFGKAGRILHQKLQGHQGHNSGSYDHLSAA